jgi:hypothetical protein
VPIHEKNRASYEANISIPLASTEDGLDEVALLDVSNDCLPVANIVGVAKWITSYIIGTSFNLLNMMDYGTGTSWRFAYEDMPLDHQALHWNFVLWREEQRKRGPSQDEESLKSRSMLLFVIPPWLMGLDDFRSFVDVEAVQDLQSCGFLREKLRLEDNYMSPWELLWCDVCRCSMPYSSYLCIGSLTENCFRSMTVALPRA